jgi:hypothetical protein
MRDRTICTSESAHHRCTLVVYEKRIMNFEFKKVGGVAKIESIEYSTPRKGARMMNFEFKKATGEYQEFIRPDASGPLH